MERKHQVFVSSTYKDLVEERQHVIHALLELDCIPSGMELFPATDEDAWTLIKEVIDNSDYYLLIIAGKYGSQNNDGISYTEMEFDYAVSINKPIMCFLHQNLDDLTGSKIEKLEEAQKKLENFRTKAQEKHCKYWKNGDDLGGKISRSLVQLRKKHPSHGWIPGKYAADEKLFRRLEEMRVKIQELEEEKKKVFDSEPESAKNLSKGSETFSHKQMLRKIKNGPEKKFQIEVSWDKIFEYVGSLMIGECTEEEFKRNVKLAYFHSLPDGYIDTNSFDNIIIVDIAFAKIKIQLQALGLITYGSKKRTVSDTNTYWKLTPYGENYLLQVSALKSGKE
jgi:hypothetical protein